MLELGVFKNGFQQGRLLWLEGPIGTGKVRITYGLLSLCQVNDAKVLQLTAKQFVDVLKVGSARVYAEDHEVLILRNFENLSRAKLNEFVDAVREYQNFKSTFGMRLILISSEQSERIGRLLKKLKPLIIRIRGIGDDPEELNERIHATIEKASRLTQKRVTRITEAVAVFLESAYFRKNDEELLGILVLAMLNLEGTTLKIEHFSQIAPKSRISSSIFGLYKYL